MGKRTECLRCHQNKARPTKVVLKEDGDKHGGSPWVYMCLFIGLGITLVTRVPSEWQWATSVLLMLIGTAVVTRLVLIRRKLPTGFEYNCSSCKYRWYDRKFAQERLPSSESHHHLQR